MTIDYESFEDERSTLLVERQAERRYHRALLAHPDPRDPDFPGYPGEDEDDTD